MRTIITSAQLLGIAAFVSIGATACSSSSAVPPTLGGASLPASASAGAASTAVAGRQLVGRKTANRVKPLLYAAGFSADAIFVYDQSEQSPAKPLYTITSGVAEPNGIATDTSGNLYVTNEFSNALTIYTPGSRTPIETITIGMNVPFDVAVDSTGDIFVANNPSGQSPYINEYLNGQTSPTYTWYPPQSSSTITGLALLSPGQSGGTIEATYYTFDQHGNPHGDLMQCYAGNSSCSNDGYAFGQTGGIAVDSAQPLDLLVADVSAPGIWNLNASSTKLFNTSYTPWYMAFNSAHTRLFVGDGGSEVYEYAYPRMKVRKTFSASGGYEGPHVTGVAVTP
ncbi:MAG: hypothetical protein WCC84_13900 [Candidatus Cybelea sp.]